MQTDDVFTEDYRETPYWWGLAPRPESTGTILPDRADVAIIGSGNVGLSTALTLARAGLRVVVIDAEAAGHGASTRNSGYLGRALWFKYGDLVARLGHQAAGELSRVAIDAHDYATTLIRDEQITCFYRNSGRFIAAPSRKVYDKLAHDLDMMIADGVPVDAEMISPDRQREEVASDYYHGGQLLHGNGVIHAGLYHQGLLERVQSAGATIVGYCPVKRVVRRNGQFSVVTPRGELDATDVVVATNGYTTRALPWHRRRVVPVSAFNIVTEVVDPALVRKVLPNNRPMIEHCNSPNWLRTNEDGTRFLFGGTTGEDRVTMRAKAIELRRELVHIVPDLSEIRITHCWQGKVAFTFDFLPHGGVHDGIHYAMGWCAAGVPMGTWLGHKTALRILGDPGHRTALTDRVFPGNPLYFGRPWFLPAAVAWMKYLDRKLRQ